METKRCHIWTIPVRRDFSTTKSKVINQVIQCIPTRNYGFLLDNFWIDFFSGWIFITHNEYCSNKFSFQFWKLILLCVEIFDLLFCAEQIAVLCFEIFVSATDSCFRHLWISVSSSYNCLLYITLCESLWVFARLFRYTLHISCCWFYLYN